MALAGAAVLTVVALGVGTRAVLVGGLLALLPVPLLVWAVLALDRYEPEPAANLVFTFAWGATVAAFLALVLNGIDQALLTVALGRSRGALLTAVVGAPIVEESAKALVIFGLLRARRSELDGPLDGIVYAGAVGLGFAMTENVLYYARVLHEAGGAGLAATFVLRGVLSPFAHPLFTAATGIGLGYAAIHRSRPARVLAPAAGLVVAIVLHGSWNAAANAGLGTLAGLYLLVLAPLLAGVLVVAALERRRLRRAIVRELGPYATAGWLPTYDLPMLASLAARRQARRWARAGGGRPAGRAMRRYQLAATELALLHDRWRRAGQGDAPPGEDLDRRDALLADLQAARQRLPRAAG